MDNVWLHRISHLAEVSYPLIEEGFLTIGFSDFSDAEFLQKTRAGDWENFEAAFLEQWEELSRKRHGLWRFIVEMQIGDMVIVPSWGVFSVYKIESEACLTKELDVQDLPIWNGEVLSVRDDGGYVGERHVDLGFFRRVSLIAKDIPRFEFADAGLTSRMKIRTTNANISDLAESVRKAIEAFRQNRPINLHSQILADSGDRLLQQIRNELTPDKFESLIAWYFRRLGASEVSIPSKNESDKQGDADVVAAFEPLKTIYYVQVKHHTGVTSEWAAEQVSEYKHHKERMDDGYSRIAWIVSTAESFSAECVQLAKQNGVGLFAGPDLARMILEAGIQNLEKAF
jgi:predicted Mrr-cat superfamily restriction endonuclease